MADKKSLKPLTREQFRSDEDYLQYLQYSVSGATLNLDDVPVQWRILIEVPCDDHPKAPLAMSPTSSGNNQFGRCMPSTSGGGGGDGLQTPPAFYPIAGSMQSALEHLHKSPAQQLKKSHQCLGGACIGKNSNKENASIRTLVERLSNLRDAHRRLCSNRAIITRGNLAAMSQNTWVDVGLALRPSPSFGGDDHPTEKESENEETKNEKNKNDKENDESENGESENEESENEENENKKNENKQNKNKKNKNKGNENKQNENKQKRARLHAAKHTLWVCTREFLGILEAIDNAGIRCVEAADRLLECASVGPSDWEESSEEDSAAGPGGSGVMPQGNK